MALNIFSAGGAIHRVQRSTQWHAIILEILVEDALLIAGMSDDALIQFFCVVNTLWGTSPIATDSAERDKPSTTDSLELNAQRWTRIVAEVLGHTALSVQTIPGDVLIQFLEVVYTMRDYKMRIHTDNSDPIENELNNGQPKSQSPEPQPERQPMETDGHIPPQDLVDPEATRMNMRNTPQG